MWLLESPDKAAASGNVAVSARGASAMVEIGCESLYGGGGRWPLGVEAVLRKYSATALGRTSQSRDGLLPSTRPRWRR